MKKIQFLLLLIILNVGSITYAQTSTPTPTSTQTPTKTPTNNDNAQLGNHETCPSTPGPPCASTPLKVGKGVKTYYLVKHGAGTVTASIQCMPVVAPDNDYVKLGAGDYTDDSVFTSEAVCESVKLVMTAPTTSNTTVSAWVR